MKFRLSTLMGAAAALALSTGLALAGPGEPGHSHKAFAAGTLTTRCCGRCSAGNRGFRSRKASPGLTHGSKIRWRHTCVLPTPSASRDVNRAAHPWIPISCPL